jgi:hypothetical protein
MWLSQFMCEECVANDYMKHMKCVHTVSQKWKHTHRAVALQSYRKLPSACPTGLLSNARGAVFQSRRRSTIM